MNNLRKNEHRLWVKGTMRLLLLLLATVLAGCGAKQQVDENRTVVAGTVTINGKPIPAGTILFESPEAGTATSAGISDGRYRSDRVPIGKNVVGIDTASVKYGNPAKFVAIPDKYADSGTSGLTIDVKPGTNENVNFELKP